MVKSRVFSAINANYVTVAITAPAEDMLAQEVEVKNGAGVVVPVKPLDIAAGDVTAEFEFVTAVKAADLKGVWTVNGQSYDLDLFNNLSDFLAAADQLELNAALTALGIENVKVENMPAYETAKGNVTKTAEELTVADVQKLVDDVNAKAVSVEDEAAIVKAVTDAKTAGNQVALIQALQNEAFVRVNPEWVSEATNGYMAKIAGTETKIADIQTVINTSNDAIVNAEIAPVITTIDRDDLNDAKALIESWATVDKDGKITDGTIKPIVDNKVIEIQLAVADVVGATTPTALKAKLTALAELDKANLDMKNYIDANGKAYITKLAGTLDAAKNSTTLVAGIITAVNTEEAGKLVAAVKTAAEGTDADALLKALNDLGLKQVATSNKAQYLTDKAAFVTASTAPKVKADVQKQVDASNIAAIAAATDADKLLEALKVLELKNIVDANKDAYLTGKATLITDAATVKTAIDTINQTVAENAQLKVINEAETVAEVKSALDELANVDKVADYLVIRSVDRDFVAAHVLDKRPATVGYANVGAVETEVTNAKTAHAGALTAINALKLTDTPDTVVTALDKVLDEDFAALSNVEKVNAAEAFQAQLTFKADGTLETPFVTLADVKALLK